MSRLSKAVSIIVPLYNCEKYIGACLQSLQRQTYNNIEVLVIDDCSIDKSVQIVRTFVNGDKRFSLLQNAMNKGVSYSRRRGVETAHGNYIMFVDADDYILPDMVAKMVAAIGNYDMCFCNHFLDIDGKKIKAQERTPAGIYVGKKLDSLRGARMVFSLKGFDDMSVYGTLWGKLYTRDLVVANLKYFDTELWYSEDHYLLTAFMLKMKSCIAISDYLYCYRQTLGQITHRYKEDFFTNSILLYQKWQSMFRTEESGEDLELINAAFFLKNVEGCMKAEIRDSGKSYTECYQFLKKIYHHPVVQELLKNTNLHKFDKSCCKYLTWLKYGWLRLIYYSLRIHRS
jgi:glycosyltransferase involved in cell wall biosynthesis